MAAKPREKKIKWHRKPQAVEPTAPKKPGSGTGRLPAQGAQMLMLQKLGPGLLLLFLTLGAYGAALQAGYVWDDKDYLTENPLVRSLDGLRRIWFTTQTPQYYPLVFTTFWLEHAIWGLNPFGYHLVNVLLHAANALLVWRIFHDLEVRGAWWIGAIFALHPVHVESVAWITERKNVLSGLFYLLALRQYLAFEEQKQLRTYLTAFFLFICALLSKSVTATLPAAILIVLWFQGKQITRRTVLLLAPFFLVGSVSGLFTAWLEVYKVGAHGAEWDLNLLQRFVLAGRILWFYAFKLIWPAELIFTYPRWTLNLGDPVQYTALIGVGLIAFALWVFRDRLGRGPAAGCLFFAVTLAPVLGFLDFYPMRFSFVADHFQYLASVGIIALVVAGAARTCEKWIGPKEKWRWASTAIGTVLLAVLVVLTWRQAEIYKNAETLYRNTLQKNPGSWMAHNNLGRILFGRGEVEEAARHFRAALALQPNDSEVLNNLGPALYHQGRTSEAMDAFRRSITINPNNFRARNNLGQLLLEQGRIEEGMSELREALRLQPLYPAAHSSMGMALALQGKTAEAVEHFSKALEADLTYSKARYNLAQLLSRMGRHEEAIRLLREGVRLKAEDRTLIPFLAWLLATAPRPEWRNGEEARRLARLALEGATKKELPLVLKVLAAAHAEIGQFGEAVRIANVAAGTAEAMGMREEAVRIREMVKGYERGQPFRASEP